MACWILKEKCWSSWGAVLAGAKVFDVHHLHHSLFCLVPVHAWAQVASSRAGGYSCRVFPRSGVKEALVSWVNGPREAFLLGSGACQKTPVSFLV